MGIQQFLRIYLGLIWPFLEYCSHVVLVESKEFHLISHIIVTSLKMGRDILSLFFSSVPPPLAFTNIILVVDRRNLVFLCLILKPGYLVLYFCIISHEFCVCNPRIHRFVFASFLTQAICEILYLQFFHLSICLLLNFGSTGILEALT